MVEMQSCLDSASVVYVSEMMICVEILPAAGHVRQEVGSICIEKQDMVAHDRKWPKRGGRSPSFDCICVL